MWLKAQCSSTHWPSCDQQQRPISQQSILHSFHCWRDPNQHRKTGLGSPKTPDFSMPCWWKRTCNWRLLGHHTWRLEHQSTGPPGHCLPSAQWKDAIGRGDIQRASIHKYSHAGLWSVYVMNSIYSDWLLLLPNCSSHVFALSFRNRG